MFVNTNLQLFYTAFIDKNYISLYYLIVGMVLQKNMQILVLGPVFYWVMNWFATWRYFKKVKKLAIEQKKNHENFLNNTL